jgi:hypothetical protein
MKIQIKNRFDQSVIFETEAANTREAVLAAISQKVSLSYADLRSAVLRYADLRYADLSYAVLRSADLRYADLSYADLRYAVLSYADLSYADLRYAVLSYADLRSADLRYAVLRYADLRSADLSSADLRYADLRSADLRSAVLRSAVLNEKTKLPHYVPKIPDLDLQILKRVTDGKGHLEMDTWHKCETTHCRAGWSVVVAGEAGSVLESLYDTETAAMFIYQASTGSVPNFFASNDEAMADLKKCAGVAA